MPQRLSRMHQLGNAASRRLAFPKQLETAYREYQCQEAVSSFRINSVPITLLYLLLVSGIYTLAPDTIRWWWLAVYSGVGATIGVTVVCAQIHALDPYFPRYAAAASFIAVALSMAIPGFVDDPVASRMAHVSVIYALIVIYSMVGLRFPMATLACWGGGLVGWGFAEWQGNGIDWDLAHRTYTGINLLGMFVCYTAEVKSRTLFFKQHQLQRQKAKSDALAERLQRLSEEDPLTGLANRRYFDNALDREWRRAQRREDCAVTLILVDVDYFKAYNDHYGHVQGDYCLQGVANVLQRCCSRAGEVVARYGGEEFVLLYPDVDAEQATLLAERLCEQIRALAIPHKTSDVDGVSIVTVSAGVATISPYHGQNEQALLNAADHALYQAKSHGRNGWCFAQEADAAAVNPQGNESKRRKGHHRERWNNSDLEE